MNGDQQYAGSTGLGGIGKDTTTAIGQQKICTPPRPVTIPMGAKLSKIAEIFELDIIDEEEALKACKVIIGQHAKKQGHTEDSAKIVK